MDVLMARASSVVGRDVELAAQADDAAPTHFGIASDYFAVAVDFRVRVAKPCRRPAGVPCAAPVGFHAASFLVSRSTRRRLADCSIYRVRVRRETLSARAAC